MPSILTWCEQFDRYDLIQFSTALADPPPCNCRTKEVYTKTFSWPTDWRAVSSRRDAVLLARLRSGHTPFLKAYANQLDTTVDPKCPSCGEEPQTVEHWLQRCPNAVAIGGYRSMIADNPNEIFPHDTIACKGLAARCQ